MDFHVGDPVVHWTFGIGEIVGVEERFLFNKSTLFYMVQVRDLTVCVPIDSRTDNRLRSPTSPRGFKKLFKILQGSGEPLIEDRFERKAILRKGLADGKAETICQVIRDLSALSHNKALNDDDKNILRRAQSLLCAEWGFSLSIPIEQAESELQHLLIKPSDNPAG
jgi:RNA polymerase-interacting CarD/CdnL/TRCF family regulator